MSAGGLEQGKHVRLEAEQVWEEETLWASVIVPAWAHWL